MYRDLLQDYSPLGGDGIYNATIKGRGLYNTFHFVLRLSPAVHRQLSNLPLGILDSSKVDIEQVEAFSTYLHETVHWWQHIGSTYGLMLSMTYPVQAHANYSHLKDLIKRTGFKKSIRKIAEEMPNGGFGTTSGVANIVINNHYDMECFRGITISPSSADKIVQNPLFENIGHSYQIAHGNIISMLASVSDKSFNLIPHPKEWSEHFQKLREDKEEGYYYGLNRPGIAGGYLV